MTDLPHPSRVAAASRVRAVPAAAQDWAMAVGFSAFILWQLAQHAFWRDELNAWGIALASTSLADLFARMHYEGHPGLWHLTLWIVSHVSRSPECLKVVHGVMAVGIVGLIALRSSFGRLEKLLLLLSYFVLFEYTVISRNYGIGMLLALLYCLRRSEHPEQTGRNALLLGLLANTNVFALALSGALALEYIWDFVVSRRAAGRPWLVAALPPVAIYLAFVGLSVATFWPAHDISWRTTGRPLDEAIGLRLLTATIDQLAALFPIDLAAFWGPDRDFAPPDDVWQRIGTLAAAPILILLVGRPLIRTPRLLLIPAVTFLGALALEYLVYGSIRHWGINYVAVVAALWLGRTRAAPSDVRWSLPLLAVNALAGIVFTVTHWGVPFSNSGATADWLRAHGRDAGVLVGTPDTHVAAVAELLGRPAYFLDCRCSDTYLKFHNRRDGFRRAQLIDDLVTAPIPADPSVPATYIDIRALTESQIADLARRGLAVRFEGATSGALQENFFIYSVARIDPAPVTVKEN